MIFLVERADSLPNPIHAKIQFIPSPADLSDCPIWAGCDPAVRILEPVAKYLTRYYPGSRFWRILVRIDLGGQVR